MNAVEIEQAISALALQQFDPENFPYQFLEAFGNKKTTIDRLKLGSTNKSDVENGVLQRSNIHIAICDKDTTTQTLSALRESPATSKAKAKLILATDGYSLEAEDLNSGETISCDYKNFPDHFGFFLPLAGISTVKQIRDNPIDIKATSRLNQLYVELNKNNPTWANEEGRHNMNQFMTRLIFCFFAEDTNLLGEPNLFTNTIQQMTDAQSNNLEYVIGEIFRAMDIPPDERDSANLPRWANAFPYVNGGLYAGSKNIPTFTRIARSYLLHAGNLDWSAINPDIFGSMIQAVADDEERGDLGMHYTSVPNILKVLNPLFLDDLREQLEEAGDNPRKLLNLRKRISNIRVFDPACGSGNFLVIAYIQLREIEAEIVKRRTGDDPKSWIKLENFFGIEIKDFAVEVARLSLLIAEFQSDVRYIGQREATVLCLPLKKTGKILQGNALQLSWDSLLPLSTNENETYICGNPPYLGSTWQSKAQKEDLKLVAAPYTKSWKLLDYVCGWFIKAANYLKFNNGSAAFVSTNSICQGQQVPILWPVIYDQNITISFAYTSFKWANLATHNAGVTVIIVGITNGNTNRIRCIYSQTDLDHILQKVENINPYLICGESIIVNKTRIPLSQLTPMSFGNKPVDGGNLLLSRTEFIELKSQSSEIKNFTKRIYGSAELIKGLVRYCLWIEDSQLPKALENNIIKKRIEASKQIRIESKDKGANTLAIKAHQFREMYIGKSHSIALPSVSSENRKYLPVNIFNKNEAITNLAFALYDAPLWNMALIASKLHLVWIATICGKLETRYRYSNTLGWNTFPVPPLTEKNKADLTRCAEEILLAREEHFPKTIADLYDPEKMPENLKRAHERNDEVLERIYIGRLFKNDTERLEKLFELYTKMIEDESKDTKKKASK